MTQVFMSGTPTGDQLFGLFQSLLVEPCHIFVLLVIEIFCVKGHPLPNVAVTEKFQVGNNS